MKAANPCKSRRISALEELAESNRACLLNGFREIGLEILGEVFPFTGFNRVPAEFDDWEILHLGDVIRRFGLCFDECGGHHESDQEWLHLLLQHESSIA